jgi:hypothetical protein
MIRIILAAAATLALVSAAPAFACPDCEHHKDQTASADKQDSAKHKHGDAAAAEKDKKGAGQADKAATADDDCPCHKAKKAEKKS